jgi:hypothetical protein
MHLKHSKIIGGVNPNPHGLWMKKPFFQKTEITPGRLKKIILLKIKKAKISQLTFISRASKKRHFQCAFDENVSVTNVF